MARRRRKFEEFKCRRVTAGASFFSGWPRRRQPPAMAIMMERKNL